MIALILVSRFSTSFQFRFWLNPRFISLFFSTKSSHFISSHYTRRMRGWASPFHFTHFPRFIGSFSSGIDIETTTIWQKAEDQDQELSAPCMGGPIWGTQNIAVCEVLGSLSFHTCIVKPAQHLQIANPSWIFYFWHEITYQIINQNASKLNHYQDLMLHCIFPAPSCLLPLHFPSH